MHKDRKIRLGIFLMVCFGTSFFLITQVEGQKRNKSSLNDPNTFPEWVQPTIPGAPKLGRPQLIMGETMPAISQGMGWAAPAVYDWNGDGKKDLLIGEFGSGLENEGMAVGHFIRVYENEGTDAEPKFNDDFYYARRADADMTRAFSTGSPLSIHTFCCFAFTPRFADIDNDGFDDLLSGQYTPGYITWFRGSENGFLSGVKLEEVYTPKSVKISYAESSTDPESMNYWMYSSAAFGDFNGDGKQDMVVGGHGIRLSKNIGTKSDPLFGKRELLLDVNGDPLKIRTLSEEDIKKYYNPEEKDSPFYHCPPAAGTGSNVPYVVDWDQDGVLDILMTEHYENRGGNAVTYFRGVKIGEDLRFEPGIALFSAKDGGKAFPGAWLNVCVTDWNNDGVNDLLIGTSVATLDGGKFNHELSWQWESETGISKQNQAYTQNFYKKRYVEPSKKRYEERRLKLGLSVKEMEEKYGKWEPPIRGYKEDDPYMTLAHQGYVYVMLGKMEN